MTSRDEKHQLLAMSHAAGQLDPDRQAEFDTLYADDENFRALVAEMQVFTAPLNEPGSKQAPPEGLLDEIMQTIDQPETADVDLAQVDTSSVNPFPWRPLAIAASFIAAASTGLHFIPDAAAPAQGVETSLLALLSGEEVAAPLVVIVYQPETQTVIAHAASSTIPDDRVWQLWLIRADAAGPRSLGLFTSGIDSAMALEVDQVLVSGTDTLAISLEPPGGSPDPGPSGPVLFSGRLTPLAKS